METKLTYKAFKKWLLSKDDSVVIGDRTCCPVQAHLKEVTGEQSAGVGQITYQVGNTWDYLPRSLKRFVRAVDKRDAFVWGRTAGEYKELLT